jgi:imidazolonepropionase-like amidohydrolase
VWRLVVLDEMVAMASAGMSPLSALQTATLNPARYLGMEQALGSIAVGKRADLVVLEANPLTDIANVRRVRAVVLGERLLDRTAIDTLLAQTRAAAAQ